MKVTPARVRFVLEATFLIVVAAICWAASLSWKGIVPAMAGAWVLVTLVERSANSDRRRGGEDAPAEPEPEAEVPPPSSHVTVLDGEPAAEQPPTPIPEPGPEPGPTPEPIPPAPEPSPPRPEPTPLPDPNPQLEVVPDPEPEPEPEFEPIAEPTVARLPQRDGAPREWNVWELERIARDVEGNDAGRDQELAFLLLELRQFANADGMLPPSFDPVIREAFGELLYAGI
jgi:outer membrane biosynthesis protein TonB